jgi:hypothetical protein
LRLSHTRACHCWYLLLIVLFRLLLLLLLLLLPPLLLSLGRADDQLARYQIQVEG